VNLAEKVREVPDWPQPGVGFKDVTPLLADPAALKYSIDQLAEWGAQKKPDLIVGAEARGFILGAAIANEIGSADVDVNVPRHVEVHELRPEMRSFPDDLLRDHAVAEDVLLVINVVEEQVQRRDSLDQTAFDFLPFVGGNNAGQEIKRENPFRSLVVAVDRESDALDQESGGGEGAFPLEFLVIHFLEAVEQLGVMRPGHAGPGKHFVKEISDFVIGEQITHHLSLAVR
jgi:hypothetical protein